MVGLGDTAIITKVGVACIGAWLQVVTCFRVRELAIMLGKQVAGDGLQVAVFLILRVFLCVLSVLCGESFSLVR